MTDIVKRLRDVAAVRTVTPVQIFHDAAAEIERLHEDAAQIKRHEMCLMEEIERMRVRDEMADERVGALEREIERFKAAQQLIADNGPNIEAMNAEIERLRDHHARNLGWEKRARAAEAALRRIADYPTSAAGACPDIARAALERK